MDLIDHYAAQLLLLPRAGLGVHTVPVPVTLPVEAAALEACERVCRVVVEVLLLDR